MNYFTCSAFMQEAEINSVLSTTSNLTILVPSPQAIENMDEDEKAFWMSKSNIPTLLKYANGLVLFLMNYFSFQASLYYEATTARQTLHF